MFTSAGISFIFNAQEYDKISWIFRKITVKVISWKMRRYRLSVMFTISGGQAKQQQFAPRHGK